MSLFLFMWCQYIDVIVAIAVVARPHHLLEAHVSGHMVKREVTEEGEVIQTKKGNWLEKTVFQQFNSTHLLEVRKTSFIWINDQPQL